MDEETELEDDSDDEHVLVEKATEILALLILGAGLLALGLGYSWFWLVFVLGFAVVLPLTHVVGELLVEVLAKGDDEPAGEPDPLEVLKERYARGEIDEAEFERRLDVVVDADSPAEARARLERRRESGARPADGDRAGDRDAAEGRSRDVDLEPE